MLKTAHFFTLAMAITVSSSLFADLQCQNEKKTFVTIKDLRVKLNDQKVPRGPELTQLMHELNTRYKDIPQQKEYLISLYHRLTEEAAIIAGKLKEAQNNKAPLSEVLACNAALNLKNAEILSLKKSYQRETGTSDIETDAAPVLEALRNLQQAQAPKA